MRSKRLVCLIIAAALIAGFCFTQQAGAIAAAPDVKAEAAILIDMDTGKILYEKNSGDRHYPASTTKMMTAILAIENLDLTQDLVIDNEVAATGGNSMKLVDGEIINAKDVLYAMMVMSANDGAVALAKAIAGSVPEFCEMMNQKAKSLGCTDTHFVNPNGLHNDDHYSTAADLARIALYCMKNETFREIVCLSSYTVPATNASGVRVVETTNLLLNDATEKNMVKVNGEMRYCKYPGCIGIKTGQTPQAKGCLVSAAIKDGTRLLCVVLESGALERFGDSISLLDWGFASYRKLAVMNAGEELMDAKVKKGTVNTLKVLSGSNILLTLPSDVADSMIKTEIKVGELTAPIEKGQVVGSVVIYKGSEVLATYPAIAADSIEEGGVLSRFGIPDRIAKYIWLGLGGIVALFVISFGIAVILRVRKIKRKKALRAARLAEQQAARKKQEEEQRRQWDDSYESRYKL